jgi:hypothetical protein
VDARADAEHRPGAEVGAVVEARVPHRAAAGGHAEEGPHLAGGRGFRVLLAEEGQLVRLHLADGLHGRAVRGVADRRGDAALAREEPRPERLHVAGERGDRPETRDDDTAPHAGAP